MDAWVRSRGGHLSALPSNNCPTDAPAGAGCLETSRILTAWRVAGSLQSSTAEEGR